MHKYPRIFTPTMGVSVLASVFEFTLSGIVLSKIKGLDQRLTVRSSPDLYRAKTHTKDSSDHVVLDPLRGPYRPTSTIYESQVDEWKERRTNSLDSGSVPPPHDFQCVEETPSLLCDLQTYCSVVGGGHTGSPFERLPISEKLYPSTPVLSCLKIGGDVVYLCSSLFGFRCLYLESFTGSTAP